MDLIIHKRGNKKVFLFSKTKLFEVLTIQDVCELNFRSCCEMHVEICSPAAGAATRVSMRGMNSAVKEQTTTGNLGLDSIRNIGSAKTFLLRWHNRLAFHLVSTPRPREWWCIIDLKSLCKPLTVELKGPRGQIILKQ